MQRRVVRIPFLFQSACRWMHMYLRKHVADSVWYLDVWWYYYLTNAPHRIGQPHHAAMPLPEHAVRRVSLSPFFAFIGMYLLIRSHALGMWCSNPVLKRWRYVEVEIVYWKGSANPWSTLPLPRRANYPPAPLPTYGWHSNICLVWLEFR